MFLNRICKNRIWELWCLRKYSFVKYNPIFEKQSIIAVADDSVPKCGGLVDRLKGIVSLYHYSIVTGRRFYINYTYPFDLSKYLLPNKYNWKISIDKYNIYQCKTLYLIGEVNGERLFKYDGRRSLLVYSNFNLISYLNNHYNTDFLFGELFRTLFKPSEFLKKEIDYIKNRYCSNTYIAVHFRFQQLLGDFKDIDGIVLGLDEQRKMISDCLMILNHIQRKHYDVELLIFSDSFSFIEECKGNGYSVIPGTIGHIDFNRNEDVFLKTFVDFYLISESVHVYSVVLDKMYPSAFPEFASMLNNIPFERVCPF